MSVRLVAAETTDHWREARRLVEEYASTLEVDLSFQGFAHEIEHLATEYGPPNGAFLLAMDGETCLGCVGVRLFAARTGEIKRLYVPKSARGRGVGRLLVEGIVAAARRLRFERLVLDTLPSMKEAQGLYVSAGFRTTAAYRFNPVPGTAYFEFSLVKEA